MDLWADSRVSRELLGHEQNKHVVDMSERKMISLWCGNWLRGMFKNKEMRDILDETCIPEMQFYKLDF